MTHHLRDLAYLGAAISVIALVFALAAAVEALLLRLFPGTRR